MPRISTDAFTEKHSARTRLGFYQRMIDFVFTPMHKGALVMVLPNGEQLSYGSKSDGVQAQITVRDNNFFKRCVLFGDVGFAESYMEGEWDSEDLTKVIEWMLINVENHPTMSDKKMRFSPVNFLKGVNNFHTLMRQNTLNGSRQNISAHYDLGNDFYELFLDSSMTYSAAYFKNVKQTLQEAQLQKYEELARKLKLKESDHLLEIGSGWGGFAVYAVKNFGCRVTTVTISTEQFEYAKKRILAENLQDKIDIQFKDYRFLTGKFDKIVSIEMIEAVGHKFYKKYFRQCHQLLKKDGLLALQMILSPDHRYENFRKNVDFIQKYIFPGSLLPSMAVVLKTINQTGDLNVFDFEDITPHYAKTLKMWSDNFNVNLEKVRSQGFDEGFIRKWNYYWSYCEAAFTTRNISVAQVVFSRPNNLSIDG
jgi:cyclopropane-fatty-acyl-phospholipid synthase